MAGAEAGIAEVDLDKTFDLLPLVLEAVENAENPENFSKLTAELNVKFLEAKKVVAQFAKAPAVDPAQIRDLEAHDLSNKQLLSQASKAVPTD